MSRSGFAGDTAVAEETVNKTSSDLVRVVPIACALVLLVLAAFLRALVAPLYLVAASLLALAASLGATTLVFQDLLGFGELSFYVPFAGIVLLIALGSDYNVYLVGEVWEEARALPWKPAIETATRRARSAITVAGLVLALSFAMLAIVPLRPFRELAFLLCTGLLIDAFVVRSFLAPALLALVGRRSAWPGKMPDRRGGALNRRPQRRRPTSPDGYVGRNRFGKDRRRPTLPGGFPPSTIGAEGLNGSVRNGKRCIPLAIATEIGRNRVDARAA